MRQPGLFPSFRLSLCKATCTTSPCRLRRPRRVRRRNYCTAAARSSDQARLSFSNAMPGPECRRRWLSRMHAPYAAEKCATDKVVCSRAAYRMMGKSERTMVHLPIDPKHVLLSSSGPSTNLPGQAIGLLVDEMRAYRSRFSTIFVGDSVTRLLMAFVIGGMLLFSNLTCKIVFLHMSLLLGRAHTLAGLWVFEGLDRLPRRSYTDRLHRHLTPPPPSTIPGTWRNDLISLVPRHRISSCETSRLRPMVASKEVCSDVHLTASRMSADSVRSVCMQNGI